MNASTQTKLIMWVCCLLLHHISFLLQKSFDLNANKALCNVHRSECVCVCVLLKV